MSAEQTFDVYAHHLRLMRLPWKRVGGSRFGRVQNTSDRNRETAGTRPGQWIHVCEAAARHPPIHPSIRPTQVRDTITSLTAAAAAAAAALLLLLLVFRCRLNARNQLAVK